MVDANGLPLNPFGRTGLIGRGLLGRWGPNHALDAVVTRWKRLFSGDIEMKKGKKVMEFLAVKRKDVDEWAIPGVSPHSPLLQFYCYQTQDVHMFALSNSPG